MVTWRSLNLDPFSEGFEVSPAQSAERAALTGWIQNSDLSDVIDTTGER
jgi:hypothetical protein